MGGGRREEVLPIMNYTAVREALLERSFFPNYIQGIKQDEK